MRRSARPLTILVLRRLLSVHLDNPEEPHETRSDHADDVLARRTPASEPVDTDARRRAQGLGHDVRAGARRSQRRRLDRRPGHHAGDEQGRSASAGAGAEGWFQANEVLELLEAGFAEEFEEGAGFTSGDHEAVDGIELLGLLDKNDLCAEFFQTRAVGVEVAL